MDEIRRKQIEELERYVAAVDPENKFLLQAMHDVRERAATAAIDAEKRRAFAEARLRRMEEDRRNAMKEAEIHKWMSDMRANGNSLNSASVMRPTPELMARQIHESRCQIIAMTIMGDLYAR
jgi:hypothetical protein